MNPKTSPKVTNNLATQTKTDMKPTPQGWVILTREKAGDFEVQNDTSATSGNGSLQREGAKIRLVGHIVDGADESGFCRDAGKGRVK